MHAIHSSNNAASLETAAAAVDNEAAADDADINADGDKEPQKKKTKKVVKINLKRETIPTLVRPLLGCIVETFLAPFS